MQWEKYKLQPHDNWWMNFVRASRFGSNNSGSNRAVSPDYLAGLSARLRAPPKAGTREPFQHHRVGPGQIRMKLIYFNTSAEQLVTTLTTERIAARTRSCHSIILDIRTGPVSCSTIAMKSASGSKSGFTKTN